VNTTKKENLILKNCFYESQINRYIVTDVTKSCPLNFGQTDMEVHANYYERLMAIKKIEIFKIVIKKPIESAAVEGVISFGPLAARFN